MANIDPIQYLYTSCDECDKGIMLSTVYSDGDLIGDECVCGYWVSRYTYVEDEDEPYDEGYYYSGTGEWSGDDSYIDYLNR